jgi:hypothetical protein
MSDNLSFKKRTLAGWMFGVEHRGMRSLFQKASVTWGKSFWLRESMIGGGKPFSVIPWHLLALQLRKSKENSVRVAG